MSQADEAKFPPAPPLPPPPPLPSLNESKSNPQSLNTSELSKVDENELDLAIERLRTFETTFREIFYLSNTSLMPQLQDGPKCGLVALSIATSVLQNFVKVDDLFETAVSLGFTKQGEMFSTKSLAVLAEKCSFKTKIIEDGLSSHLHCLIKSLLRKCLLLIPYDADFNHAPCCKKGVKAHWTVITGFIILEQAEADSNMGDDDAVLVKSAALCDCTDRNSSNIELPLTISLHQGQILIRKRPLKEIQGNYKEGKIYLIGMQGKSRHVGLWPFNEMAESNLNLNCFSTARDSSSFVIPDGDLEEGLKGKAIILDYSGLPRATELE